MSYYITGTDTHVGKTLVSCLLCLKTGYHYWKPIQSGIKPYTDSEWVSKYIDKNKIIPEVYKLKKAAAPDYSAQLENIEISIDNILAKLPNKDLIIEGAGGVYVPINKNQLQIELIKKLNLEVIVVTRGTIGTINHTLLTIDALRKNKINIKGIVINRLIEFENKQAIERHSKLNVLGVIPELKYKSINRLLEITNLIK